MEASTLGLGLIIGLVIGAGIGFVIVRMLLNKSNQSKIEEINQKADLAIQEARVTAKRIVAEAETKSDKLLSNAENNHERIKQKKIQEAKDKFNKLRSEFDSEKAQHKIELKEREVVVVDHEKELKRQQDEFKQRIDSIDSKETELNAVRDNLDKQLKIVAKKKEELDASIEKEISLLENIAKLSETEAKEQLLEAVKGKAESEAMAFIKESMEQAKATANKDAKKIVIQTIQRMAAEYTIENTVSVFNLDSDDIKGQIIGREGRNIRALEAATGAEIVVDDTPEAIVISSFDPIRREIARLALKRLVADGRIHPARIEEVVQKVKEQLNEQIVEIGERTVIDLDIHGMDPYLVKMVGRMRFGLLTVRTCSNTPSKQPIYALRWRPSSACTLNRSKWQNARGCCTILEK